MKEILDKLLMYGLYDIDKKSYISSSDSDSDILLFREIDKMLSYVEEGVEDKEKIDVHYIVVHKIEEEGLGGYSDRVYASNRIKRLMGMIEMKEDEIMKMKKELEEIRKI